MTHPEEFAALPADAQQRLTNIAALAADMSIEERHAASQVFATVTSAYALNGADIDIPGAQMLGDLIDLLLIANREERRTHEREAV